MKVVGIKLAKLLKEKGFDLESPAIYGIDNLGREGNKYIEKWTTPSNLNKYSKQGDCCTYNAPFLWQVVEWLYRFEINVHILITKSGNFTYEIIGKNRYVKWDSEDSDHNKVLELALINVVNSLEV